MRTRVFLVVRSVDAGTGDDAVDPLTGLRRYKLGKHQTIIGLSAVQTAPPHVLYMIPFHINANDGSWHFLAKVEEATECSLLHVDWDIGFM